MHQTFTHIFPYRPNIHFFLVPSLCRSIWIEMEENKNFSQTWLLVVFSFRMILLTETDFTDWKKKNSCICQWNKEWSFISSESLSLSLSLLVAFFSERSSLFDHFLIHSFLWCWLLRGETSHISRSTNVKVTSYLHLHQLVQFLRWYCLKHLLLMKKADLILNRWQSWKRS